MSQNDPRWSGPPGACAGSPVHEYDELGTQHMWVRRSYGTGSVKEKALRP